MTKKLLLFMLLLIPGVGAFESNAQCFIVKAGDGTKNTKVLADLQRFTFSGSKLLLKHLGETTDTVAINYVSKIYFKTEYTTVQTVTSVADVDASNNMSIYPNPAVDQISIKNAPSAISPVLVFRIDGTLVLQSKISAESPTLGVSQLEKGLYFLKINNQAFKFIKL